MQKQNDILNKSHRRKYMLAAVIPLLIIAVLVFILLTREPKFDPISEKIIREIAAAQLNKNPNELTDEDFTNVTELKISDKELSDISMLVKFLNLQKLSLNYIRFPEDKIPIWMTLLGKIGVISKMKIELLDFGKLEKLPNLNTLDLQGTQIRNIKFVKGLKKLQLLNLTSTQVCDLKPLNRLISLEKLILDRTQVSDLDPLKNMKNLQHLELQRTKVSDIEPIKGLVNLQMLSLRNTQISDLEPLKSLTNLRVLYIKNCLNIKNQQVEDLQKALPNLEIRR